MKLAAVLMFVMAVAAAAEAQGGGPANALSAANGLPSSYAGPPVPEPPATIARDEQGRMTIRAVRLSTPLRIDGQIDEAAYHSVEPISDFIQMEPSGGQPATEKTEVWLFFDSDNVYVTMRAWESHPERMIVNEMRRDSNNIRQGDCVAFSLDTFYDRRNALQFEINPLGARTDGQSTNERQYNGDWNPVWKLAVGKFNGGWTMEAAIPFKSIRYRPGRAQLWGFNARRNNKWKNEISYLARIPPSYGMGRGDFSASLFATVVGIDAPAGSKNVEIKPYATTDLTTDRLATPRISNDPGGGVGVDAKYGVTQNLTADLTYNTDFAQVEADEQQVNLTRFTLFFPEKRDFFLENQGTFTFGGAGGGVTAGGGGGGGSNRSTGSAASGGGGNNSGDTPILFYSRRIGLNQGLEVPVRGGGRVTGRVGRWSLGLLNIQTGDKAAASATSTNFSVVRVKRDVLRRSYIGAILTNRSVTQSARGSNQAYGVDGTFAFFNNLLINSYWAKTRTDGLEGDDISYRAQLEYLGDRYGVSLERLRVGDNFNPEAGFLRRDNMKRSYAQLRFSPRPRSIRAVRKFSWVGSFTYIENGAGRLESRNGDGEFAIEFQNSDRFSAGFSDTYELLTRPFAIIPRVSIPVGGYDFSSGRVAYSLGQQRPISGNLSAEYGTFYDGHLGTIGFSRPRVNVSPRFSVEPSISLNFIDLPSGSFTAKLIGSRMTYTVTPLMFVSALLQYNSNSSVVSSNIRFRWEYRPGSELFVVYNDERDSLTRGLPDLKNRAFIVKVNRLFRF